MMTEPGAKRRLYFDFDVLSETTTTSPFTTLDMDFYCSVFSTAVFGCSLSEAHSQNLSIFSDEHPNRMMNNGKTRQYNNFGFYLRNFDTQKLSEVSHIVQNSTLSKRKQFLNMSYTLFLIYYHQPWNAIIDVTSAIGIYGPIPCVNRALQRFRQQEVQNQALDAKGCKF